MIYHYHLLGIGRAYTVFDSHRPRNEEKEFVMRNLLGSLIGAGVLAATTASFAVSTDIPASGLPSASTFSSTLLPEKEGVVSWKTLAQVEPTKQGDKMVAKFSQEVLNLDSKAVRVQGFIVPLDIGDQQQHFLLSAVPPHCPFCMPAGPDAVVEVLARKKVAYGLEPVLLTGKFVVLKDDASGLLYRLTDAEPITTSRK